ncbi:MAG: Rieske 2Fe-2S domain-containing protein [Actinomycetota bacterium]
MNADDVARRYWYPAALRHQLDDGPVALTLLGEALVVALMGDEVVAFPDRCGHRGAALSNGEVQQAPDGTACLVCPYHGLHLDAGGRPAHLPARPGSRLARRLGVEPFSATLRDDIVWVSLDSEPVGGLPEWEPHGVPDRLHFQLAPIVWNVGPTRIAENFNDLAHFATVHAGSFGDPTHPIVPEETLLPTDNGFRHWVYMHQLDRVTMDGPAVPIEVEFHYEHVMPFATELRISYAPDRIEWIQVAFSPMTSLDDPEPATMVFQQNVRNFDLDGDVTAWHDFQAAVNEEDRVILESIRPRAIAVDGHGADESALAVDVFTSAYRRAWRTLLDA